jgi:hypothetical protein
MADCEKEQSTCHYRGKDFGFGPVRNDEDVLFAVFEDTALNGNRLDKDAFTTNLNDSSQSVARTAYVSKADFDQYIAPGGARGISVANVARIRSLVAELALNSTKITIRSICVLDKVEAGDCDGHATLGYCEALTAHGISPGQLGKRRVAIKADLANVFSEVVAIDVHPWPTATKSKEANEDQDSPQPNAQSS